MPHPRTQPPREPTADELARTDAGDVALLAQFARTHREFLKELLAKLDAQPGSAIALALRPEIAKIVERARKLAELAPPAHEPIVARLIALATSIENDA